MRTVQVLQWAAIAAGMASSVWAQSRPMAGPAEPRYEFGVGVMGGFSDSKTLTGSTGTAKAGFEMGVGGSVWLGHNMYNRVSGELRYDYLKQDLKLDGGGTKVTFGGQSHAIHYDIHYHFADRGARVRPYVLAGVGMKFYQGTGTEQPFQPLQTIAVLTKTTDMKPLVSVGVGVKMKISGKVNMRIEFRDNLSPFPKKVIQPTLATGAGGWTNNFLPLFGLGFEF